MNFYLNLLTYSSFFANLATGLLGPIYALFVEDLGGDVIVAGTSFAIFSIVSGVLILFISKFENTLNNDSLVFFISRFLYSIGIIGYLFIDSIYELYFIQIIMGIAVALGSPVFDSLYSKYLDGGEETLEWGIWEAQYQIALGLSAFIGGWIVFILGFKFLIIIMLILSILSTILALFLHVKVNKKYLI